MQVGKTQGLVLGRPNNNALGYHMGVFKHGKDSRIGDLGGISPINQELAKLEWRNHVLILLHFFVHTIDEVE